MAIIYSYPQINLSSISADDLMIISDMNADGRPTKSLTLKNLADFVTSTGTGTGTTNKIIKWSDGPAGLLGDSIMNEDVDKIYVDGQLRIGSSSGTSRIQIFYGSDSDTSHINNAPQDNQIIGRAGDLIIKNRARARDIVFQADNGEYNGTVDTYFRLDGSMADIGTSSYYTRWGDNSYIAFGNSAGTYPDFYMGHDGSGTILKNHTTNLNIESKGGIYIENNNGGSGEITITQSVTNEDINISAYNGNYLRVDTSAGATIFSKPVEVPLVPAANANAASKQYVDQQIASIPAGLVFQGNWNANTNTPALASGVGTVGNYYVVSVAGNTSLDGITDWEVGDWAVFVEVGGVDKWDKIDQTFVQGAGATGQVTFWNSINAVTGDNAFFWDNTNKRLGVGTTTPAYKLEISEDSADILNLYRPNSSTAAASFLDFNFNTADGTKAVYARIRSDVETNTNSGQGGDLSFHTANAGTITEVMRLTENGNVGIGTASPAFKTTIYSDSTTDSFPLVVGQPNAANEFVGIGLSGFVSSNGAVKAGLVLDRKSTYGVGDIHILNNTTTDNSNATLADSKFTILQNGNVGIGTTSPAAKLDVVGRIGLNNGNLNVIVGDGAGDGLTTGARNVVVGHNALKSEDEHGFNTAIGFDSLKSLNAGADAYNTAVGYRTGYLLSTGLYNTIVGGLAGDALTTGSRNVAIGYNALSAEDTGGRSVAIGYAALKDQNFGTDNYNVAVGYAAGKDIISAINNTLIGGLAGDALTTGSDNVAIGSSALTSQLTGNSNVAIGKSAMTQGLATDRNVAIGYFALNSLNYTGDSYNVAVGYNAGLSVTTGTTNTLIGGLAGDALTTGVGNIAIGYESLSAETGSNSSVAIGKEALKNQNIGSGGAYNVAIGDGAGKEITSALYNTLVGGQAGDAITTGSQNTAVGTFTLSANQEGKKNVAIGYGSLNAMNPSSALDTFNVAIGYHSGLSVTTGVQNTLIGGLAGDSLTTANNNIAIGYLALTTETSGGNNVAIGVTALQQSNGGTYNVAIGRDAGQLITTGSTNTLIGAEAGDALTTGDNNVALGYKALSSEDIGNGSVAIGAFALEDQNSFASGIILNTAVGYEAGKNITGGAGTGDENTAIGGRSLDAETTGQENTAVGVEALGGQTGANKNTGLGWRAGRAISTGSNLTLLGYNAQSSTGTVSNEITLGDSNVTALRCAVTSITSLSDERDKSDIKDLTYGLELIDSLKPKEFVWDNRAEIDAEGNEFYSANKGKKDFGFIAQEVKELDDDTLRLIYDENPERLEMSYGKLVPILVKAIQELSAEVKILKNK